jgi:cyanophycin synthetase
VPTATDLNTQNLETAAARLDITVEGLPGRFLKLTHRGRVSYSYEANLGFEPLVPFFACGDKWLTSTRLAEAGVPVTSGGVGITLNITTARDFRNGFAKAAAYLGDVLVEQQVEGENVRVTVLGGEVLGAVQRFPASVTGDGRSSVAALVEAKNALWRSGSRQNRLLRPIKFDREVDRLLARQGLDRGAVPAADRVVRLREVSNADQGGEIVDVGEALHEDHRELAITAARTLGPVLSGVDLIVEDLRRPGRVFVNEVNTTPSLYVINGMSQGRPSSAASERILRHLFDLDD